MASDPILRRLANLEERLERVERLSYLTYTDLRKVAEYAYLNVLLEVDAEEIKRIPGIRNVTDDQALKAGLSVADLVALKFKQRFLVNRCRDDLLAIAKYIAEERERDPAVVESKDESEEAA